MEPAAGHAPGFDLPGRSYPAVQPAHTWHPDVSNQAAGGIDIGRPQVLFGSCESTHRLAPKLEELHRRDANRLVIVDDRNEGVSRTLSILLGSLLVATAASVAGACPLNSHT